MRIQTVLSSFFVLASMGAALAAPPGEAPTLDPNRPTQQQIADGMNINSVRNAGLAIFTTPFSKLDGMGDGPIDIGDTTSPGGRPTLQGNGTFLRINGLDSQTCLDCHSVISSATRPPTLGVGGVGTANNNAIIMPTEIDVDDLDDLDGAAGFNGRFANPPFVFGAGGVELVAMEMTMDLRAARQQALDNPGTTVPLVTKGVDFGTISATPSGDLETTNVEGVADDLVVRPFGRKGEFATVREFDTGAMQFHFGMQPVEAVGAGIDADGDGVVDEITEGDLSALSIFIAMLERPRAGNRDRQADDGFAIFQAIGCAGCHIPELGTERETLPLRLPEIGTDPLSNVYREVNLTKPPVRFRKNSNGGIRVPLFADLKRHDMGPALAETFALVDAETNSEFTTARLWGIADSAPYLHDGRATTLTEAIEFHGGEAQSVRDSFVALSDDDKIDLLSFLRTLKTPRPNGGVTTLQRR